MNLDFDPTIDHYKALGVDAKASLDEIKKAYRKLAKQNHPDSTGGDKKKEARFKEISAAYEVLGDPKKRARYDEVREQLRGGGFRPGPGGRPTGSGPGGPGGPQVWDLSDLFSQFFAGGGVRGGPGGVHINIEDDGAGAYAYQQRGGGRRARRASHPEPEPEQKLRASDGSVLTVKGADVHSDVRLAFQDAILGTVREIATVAGSASVKIPPGTSSGQKLRLRGKGVVGPRGEAGDHYVTVHIDVPKDLDDEARRRLVDLVTYLKGRSSDGQGKKPR
jgi:DnaJ-class molecular chaperone